MKTISTLFVFLAVAVAGAQGDSKAIAVVNGQSIPSADFYHRMAHLPGVYAAYAERLIEVPPGLVTLDRMITERVTIQLAQDHNVAPTQAEIDKAYEDRKASNPMMEKDALEAGLTVDDLKYQVVIDLSRFKLLTENTIITDQEVKTNYDLHQDRYAAAKLVDVRVIVVEDDAEKAAVDAELAGGKDFGSVAVAHSVDVSKVRGGLMLGTLFDSLSQSVRDALGAIKVGGTTAWIPLQAQTDGSKPSEKLLFVRATNREALALDASLREAIRRQMMMEKGSVKNNVAKEVGEMLAKAKVEISDPAFAKAWEDLRKKATANSAQPKPAG